jgi:transcriptional regulator with XRE-family HTH domain
MSSKKPAIASAIVKLRASFGEGQQRFSERMKTSLATIARWEIGDRNPSPGHLKEMYLLSLEQDKPELAKVFADAFVVAAGYEISAGALGFQLRQLISDAVAMISGLLFEQELSPEGRTRVGSALAKLNDIRQTIRQLDIEPPARSVVLIAKGKRS